MEKNDLVTLTIEDMSSEGEGVGKIAGFPLFVKDTVIGDVANVRVTKLKKTYGYGRLMELLTPSPDRRFEPFCPIARQCGGCQLSAMTYEKQLAFKRKKVLENLRRLGGLNVAYCEEIPSDSQDSPNRPIPVQPIIGCERETGYRNKALVPFGTSADGRTICGFYAGRTHSIIGNPDCSCMLTPPENAAILREILSWMEANRLTPYNEQTGRGLIRHVLIRKGFASGQIMVCPVINAKSLKDSVANDLVSRLTSLNPAITGICCNVNTQNTNVVMGTEGIIALYGPKYIRDTIGDVEFEISPMSFFQVNPEQTFKLYSKALEYAALTGTETVWDLYCGIGTISLFLARQAKQVFGVEIVPEAIFDARRNAELNNLTNTEFFVGRSEEEMPARYREDPARFRADVVVVDPPRKGCDESLLATILQMSPQRIVYVSCDSATLARDLKWIMEHGNGAYRIEEVTPVDQFGQTVHVETVCLLSRKS